MKKKLGRLLLILMTIFSLIVMVLLGLAFYGKYQIQASPIVVCSQATSYDRLQNRFLVSTTTFPVSEEATILLSGFSFYKDFEFAMFYKGLYTKKAYLVYTYLVDNDKKVIWSVFGGVCILISADQAAAFRVGGSLAPIVLGCYAVVIVYLFCFGCSCFWERKSLRSRYFRGV